MLKLLLSRGADIQHRDNRGHTALHYLSFYVAHWTNGSYEATMNGKTVKYADPRYEAYLNIYKFLLENGSDVGLFNNYGYTPMHLAAESNSSEFMKLLLKYKADIHIPNSKGFTPLHAAADNGNTESARLLVEHGADVNVQDSYGFTPLISAVAGGDVHLVKYLIGQKANPDIKVTMAHGKVEAGDDARSLPVRLDLKEILNLKSN